MITLSAIDELRFNRWAVSAVLVIALCAMAALPTLSDETRNNVFIPFGQTVSPDLQYVEYTIPGTKTAPTRERDVLIEGGAQITQYQKRSTTITAHVAAQEDAAITLPLFGYDGYVVTLDGRETAWRLGGNNCLTVDIPAGTDAQLDVRYRTSLFFRAADAVSLAAALGLCLLTLRRRRMRR